MVIRGPWSRVPVCPNARKNGLVPEKVIGTAKGSYSANAPNVKEVLASVYLSLDKDRLIDNDIIEKGGSIVQ